MGEDAVKIGVVKRDTAARFVMNLCLIAWCCAMAEFVLPIGVVKNLCILFGSHAAILGFVTSLLMWPIRRRSIYFLLLILLSLPTVYFAIVLRNVARLRGWVN